MPDLITQLFRAIRENNPGEIKTILADFYQSPAFDPAPSLHLAAECGNREATEAILDFGLDINSQDAFLGRTALMVARQSKREDMVDYLIDKGADTTIVDRDGKTYQDY